MPKNVRYRLMLGPFCRPGGGAGRQGALYEARQHGTEARRCRENAQHHHAANAQQQVLPRRTWEVKASEKSSTTAATLFSTSCTQKEIQP